MRYLVPPLIVLLWFAGICAGTAIGASVGIPIGWAVVTAIRGVSMTSTTQVKVHERKKP